jgi:hypothetical protein
MPDRAPDLREFEALTEADELRKVVSDLQARLRKSKAKVEDLVSATVEGSRAAMVALGPVPAVAAPAKDTRRRKPEVALWHLTDWQGSKVTTTYNSDVMRERVLRYCDKAERLTLIQRADHPVRDCVIMFGGDLGEGLFNLPTQPFEIDASIFEQYARVARLCVDVVRRALALYDTVKVIGEWGNHGRVGAKRAAVPRSDNFDRMIYELARGILSDPETGQLHPRLVWADCPEDIQHVEIGNYRALLIHGDEVGRNGYASPMTIVNHVAKWQSGSHPWQFRDCYLGHYHNHAEWPLPNGLGSVYQTGSPESDNRYAGVGMAASSTPSQRLHFVDADAGRVSAAYKVWLDS